MREQLDLRQSDIQSGRKYERAWMTASMKSLAEEMEQKGKMTQEVQEFVTNLMEEIKQRQEKKE